MSDGGGGGGSSSVGEGTAHQLYVTAVRKCEALKEEYEALHKRYADLMSSHGATVSQLEVTQEEQSCLRKRYDDVCLELKGALRERNGLQQQCTAAIRQWDNALRERNEAKEQLSKVQQQRDEAMKEITNAMAFRIKATKDLSRLAEERNATFKEYSLVMSERDSVHKEIERLQEELSSSQQKLQSSEGQRKAACEELESLRREVSAVLQDRDQALKQCNDLREKYGDFSTGLQDGRCDWHATPDRHWDKVLDPKQRVELHLGGVGGESPSPPGWGDPGRESKGASQRLDDLDQANREVESLRRLADRLQVELTEAQQEAEVCKRRRDWAFSERDKIVLERESIRTLCDKLRRERDRAVSDLAEALRDSDDVKRQKNDTLKELKELREKMEAQLEKESRLKQLHSVGGSNNYSRDSAIDADLQEGDAETLDVTLRDFSMTSPGFEVTRGSDLMYPGDGQAGLNAPVLVNGINKGSTADGRLRVNDCILKINGVETSGLNFQSTLDLLKSSGSTLNMVVRRRRPPSLRSSVNTVTWQLLSSHVVGLSLEPGVFVSGIVPGSLSAQEGSIALGDRLLSINGQSLSSVESAQSHLSSASQHPLSQQQQKGGAPSSVTLCFLRYGAPSSSPPSSCSSGHNLLEKVDMALAFQFRNGHRNGTSPPMLKSSPEDKRPKNDVHLVSSGVQTELLPLSPCSGGKSSPFVLSPPPHPSSSSSSSSRSKLPPPADPQPSATLLDRAYHKIFGERRREGKKPLMTSSIRHHHHHHHHARQAEDDYQAIAELDSVLDDYSRTLGPAKPPKGPKKEPNGGTWPKYKGAQFHLTETTGTVTSLQPHKRKERKPLASFTKQHFYEKKSGNSLDSSHGHSGKGNYSLLGSERMESRTLPRGRDCMTLFVSSPDPSLGGGGGQLSSPPPPPRISSSGSSSYTSPDCGSPAKGTLGCQSNDHLAGSAPRMHYSGATSPESCLDYSVVSAHRDKAVLEYYQKRNRPRPKSAHYVLSDSECLSSLDSSLSCCKPLTASPTHHFEHHRSAYSHSEASTPLGERLVSSRNSDLSYSTAVTSVGYLRSNLPFYPIAGQRHSHIHHPMPSQSGSLCYSPTVGGSDGSHHGGSGVAVPANSSRYSSPPSLSIFTSRSGDSLLSGSESATDAPRCYSSRLGHGGRHSMKDSGRYSFTPSPSPSSQYSYSGPSPTASMDLPPSHFHPIRRLLPAHHSHHLHGHSLGASTFRPVEPPPSLEHYGSETSGTSTLPKRTQRIRIPSNPSVNSKSSGGKLSTSSIEKSAPVSERNSPLPAFTIEWLNADGTHPIATDYRGRKPSQGDLRNIYIEKSQEPLGIQICCGKGGGGIFVSSVTDNSLAAQVGLQVGDQLLEVCGINMRSATYILAANVLRQCGNSITMLVQYNPDKYEEAVLETSSSSNEEEEEEDEEDDDDDSESDSPLQTPAASPKPPARLPLPIKDHPATGANSAATAAASLSAEEDISSSATSTLTKQKVSSHSSHHEKNPSGSSGRERDISSSQQQQQQQQQQTRLGETLSPDSSLSSSSGGSGSASDPRLVVLKKSTSHLGISLLGGNAVGIFVHALQDDSPAGGHNGLRTGDQILEYNGVDLRQATAEEAAYELAKPTDKITVLVQYNVSKYSQIQDLPGDSFYIRTQVDRASADGSLAFRKDDILFVDNTMFNGVPGLWRAWLVDQEGQKVKCGFIPSKYKMEEELLMKRSLGDLNGDSSRRGSTSARRSFFRRRKHQRSHSRDTAKELASFSDVSINSCSDSGNLAAAAEDLLPPTYLRVQRLGYLSVRPVILVGPLMEVMVEKLEQEFPSAFQRCIPEVMRGSQQMMERGLAELKLVDYRRRGSHFECTTLNAVREICHKNCHALLDVCVSSVDRLNRCQIFPIVIFLKFRSTKQIREVKDSRYLTEKVTTKAAKEMHEHALKIESEHKDRINAVIPGSNLAYMCTQVKMCVEEEQSKPLWVPCGPSGQQHLNSNTSSSTTF